jgi:hypothetical protein
MTSLQSQYLLCPPLACNTVPTRLDIDSINRRIRSCGILGDGFWLSVPGTFCVVSLAVTVRFLSWTTRMQRSCAANVILGRPDHWRSAVEPLNSVVKLFLDPALDTATQNIFIGRLLEFRIQSLDLIMFIGARFPDSCNGTTNPVQQLIVNDLADLGSH